MFAAVCRNRRAWFAGLAGLLCVAALAPAWSAPNKKTPVKVTSTTRAEYRIKQGEEVAGREVVEKKVFNNNTVLFTIDATMAYGQGVTMDQHIELTLEEESYFPRTLSIKKHITQPDSTFFDHEINVEMFSNVAVITSKLRDAVGVRKIVVPTGVALNDVGILGYVYQTLFWYDREVGGPQNFQYLDPIGVAIDGGEIKLDGEETIPVMGKKLKVSVYKLVRAKLGAATVWVDKQGTIVRGEQNMFVYELVKKKSS